MRNLTINKDKCIHCGMCIEDCPVLCLEFDENKIPKFMEEQEENCIKCQHCFAICPKGALSICGKNPDNSEIVRQIDSDDISHLIKSRRSFRQYKKESIPSEIMEKLKSILPYAPTGCNIDGLHFSIVETKEKMDEIRKVTYEEIKKSNSENPLIKMCKDSDDDIIYRGATSMVIAAVDKNVVIDICETTDPIIALSYLELYAQSLGVGAVWCGFGLTVMREFNKVYSMLKIPDNYTISYVLLMGIPSIKYRRTIQPDNFSMSELR